MSVLLWLAIVVGGLLALLLALLASLLLVPVDVDAVWDEDRRVVSVAGPGLRLSFDTRAGDVELRLLSRRLGRWSTARSGRRGRRARPRRRRAARPSLRKLWAERRRPLRALRAFFRRVRVRRLSMAARLATPDPALTGWLSGAAFAARAVAPAAVRRGVRLTPDFEEESPRLALDASVRLRPLHGAILAVRLWRVARRARAAPGTASRPARVAGVWAARAWRAARRRGQRGSDRHDGGMDRPSGGGRERP